MDAIKAVLSRRSVRKYLDRKIDDELIDKILNAAMSAPSTRNLQPWHFIVVDDRKILNEIPNIQPYSSMLKEASHAILICGDVKIQETIEYMIQDCSAATMNILITARALGLGSVWLGIYPREARITGIKKLLNIPENIIPITLIALGHTDIEQNEVNRFNKERIHKNKWFV